MRRWQKITAIVAVGALALGVAAYLNRSALVLAYVGYSAEREVAKPRAIDWQQGPIEADAPIGERPPNIVFILVDDLGINDISAFGGGVAGGGLSVGAVLPDVARAPPGRAVLGAVADLAPVTRQGPQAADRPPFRCTLLRPARSGQ